MYRETVKHHYTAYGINEWLVITLAHHDKAPREGAMIDFVFVNVGHPNPLRRVVPTALRTDTRYDRAKYRELIVDAAETVLATFGFDRNALRPTLPSFDASSFQLRQIPQVGFQYIPRVVLPALREHGVAESQIARMTTGNPKRLFDQNRTY
jgi:hypothetical protein